jgi:hypothetical protein
MSAPPMLIVHQSGIMAQTPSMTAGWLSVSAPRRGERTKARYRLCITGEGPRPATAPSSRRAGVSAGFVASPLGCLGLDWFDRSQCEQCVAHDFKRRFIRLVAVLDQSERACERWPQWPHNEIGHVHGDRHLRNDRHAETRCHGTLQRLNCTQGHRRSRRRRLPGQPTQHQRIGCATRLLHQQRLPRNVVGCDLVGNVSRSGRKYSHQRLQAQRHDLELLLLDRQVHQREVDLV